MAGNTDRYGLQQLGAGDSLSLNGYKFSNDDRQTIDDLLYLGAEGHRHTGASEEVIEPEDPLDLVILYTGGTLPAGSRIYYKWTYVNNNGQETTASPEAYVDTPNPVAEPSAPVLAYSATGGVLSGGNYYYVLSAFVDADISESKALSPGYLTVPATTATNSITVTFPSAPAGATGYNIYRRSPGQSKYYWLDSVDVASPPTYFVDDGSQEEDCDRTLPKANTTNSTNSVEVTLPSTTLPTGYTWRLYRSLVQADWSASRLASIVEYTSEATPIVTTTYTDVGSSTTAETYPSQSLVVGNPQKIDFTDGVEVDGILPMAYVSYPIAVTMNVSGILAAAAGTAVWRCPFHFAEIIHVSATLGRNAKPASQNVIVDVNKLANNQATPAWATIFTTQANRPKILVNAQMGAIVYPDVNFLYRDDLLSIDVDQAGGGATPTDRDLTVTIFLIVTMNSGVSYVYSGVTGENAELGF